MRQVRFPFTGKVALGVTWPISQTDFVQSDVVRTGLGLEIKDISFFLKEAMTRGLISCEDGTVSEAGFMQFGRGMRYYYVWRRKWRSGF